MLGLLILAVEQDSFWDKFPGLWDLMVLLAACGLIAVMIWFVKGTPAVGDGFVIKVDDGEVRFSGRFPAGSQGVVAAFLRDDVSVGGRYEVRGRWDGQILAVVVKGDQARGVEQQIRNFLKASLKAPRGV